MQNGVAAVTPLEKKPEEGVSRLFPSGFFYLNIEIEGRFC